MSVGTGAAALSLSLCLCAGQLISMPAASAATEVLPTTAASQVKVRPAIHNTWHKRNLAWGSRLRVTAKLIDPKTGAVVKHGKVRLQQYRGGKWRTVTSKWLAGHRAVNLVARPRVSSYFRTQYAGSSHYLSQTSTKKRITVRNSGGKVLAEARRHRGALYRFGAAGPHRFDCSGFTMYVYRKAIGKRLPHRANSQQHYGRAVSRSHKRVGDLIVFRSGSYGYHAGIYAGGGYMYDSPHTGARVGKHKIYGHNYVVRRLAA